MQAQSRLGLLLFSEICLLACVCGIIAFRHPATGFVAFCLLWLLDLPRSLPGIRGLLLIICFFTAMGYAAPREPVQPPVPNWLAEAAFPSADEKGELLPAAPLRVSAYVESVTPLPGKRLRVIVRDLLPEKAGPDAAPYPGLCAWTWYRADTSPLPGSRVSATLRFAPQRGFVNPGTMDFERYWHDKNVFFRAWSGGKTDYAPLAPPAGPLAAPAAWRAALRERFMAALPQNAAGRPSPSAAILPALIFGDRSLLSDGQTDLFARSTLAHSLALSGLHMGFAVLAGAALAWGLGLAFPRLWLSISRPKLALLASLPVAALYLWLGQAPISLCRAALMLLFWALMLFLNRPRALLDALMAATAVLLLLNPLSVFELGLQMSVLCVAVIALILPGVTAVGQRLFPARAPGGGLSPASRAGRFCLGILLVSLCIQVALMPLTVRAFGSAGLCFPLNLVWLPALGALALPLSFLSLPLLALDLSMPAQGILWLADLPGAALMRLLEWLDRAGLLLAPLLPRPHWLMMGGFWLLCITVPGLCASFFAQKRARSFEALRPRALWPLLAALIMLAAPPALALHDAARTGVSLRLFDVGQGEAVLIQWTGLGGSSGRVLLDGGGFGSAHFDTGKAILAPALTDMARPRLDAVLNSHPDLDHLGGLPYILKHFTVGGYWGNADNAEGALADKEADALAQSGLRKRPLYAGQRLELAPNLVLECLWPPASALEEAQRPSGQEKGNNLSLALRLVWQGKPLALLCGDLENEGLDRLLRQGRELEAPVLLLPHHGSAGSLNPALYAAVAPRLALASAGWGNRWGFPSARVRQTLAEMDVPLYDTGTYGQVRLSWERPDADASLSVARP